MTRTKLSIFCKLFFCFSLVEANLLAADTFTIIKSNAKLYSEPSSQGKSIGFVNKGKKVNVIAQSESFYRLKTRSGQPVWIQKSDVRVDQVADDLMTDQIDDDDTNQFAPPSRWTFDFGLATGRVGNTSYSEFNLGVNYLWTPWLIWRNGAFFRSSKGDDAFAGIDTGLRLLHFHPLSSRSSLLAFLGGGYRFPGQGRAAPFVESGVTIRLSGLVAGLGVKAFLNRLIDSNEASDTQVYLVLGGGGSL